MNSIVLGSEHKSSTQSILYVGSTCLLLAAFSHEYILGRNVVGTNLSHIQNGHDNGVRPTNEILTVSGDAAVTTSCDTVRSTSGTANSLCRATKTLIIRLGVCRCRVD